MHQLSNSIAGILVEGNIITMEEKDQCSYGIEIILSSVGEISCVLVISLFIRNFLETLLFFLFFIPLRIYAGGYHAETRIRCFAILIGVYALFSILIKFESIVLCTVIILGDMVFTSVMILKFAPIKHSRKHLTEKEVYCFRRIAIVICLTECLVLLLVFIIHKPNVWLLSCAYGQLAVSISMVAACIKNKIHGGEHNE